MTTSTNKLTSRWKLDELFATARKHESALELALLVGDDIVGVVAAARLQRALLLLDSALPPHDPAVASMVREAVQGMRDLLTRAPTAVADRNTQKFIRWVIAMGQSVAFKGPHLFELDCHGADLAAVRFLGLHVERCRFITSMPRATFVDSLVESCDFSLGGLQNTLWQRTRVEQCFFGGASFVDATFDDATFTDCDLRGADLSVEHHPGLIGLADVQFIRCDLRDTNWTGRDLSAMRILDCKLHGMRLADLGRLNVTRGDVSAAGDGSWMIGVDSPERHVTRVPGLEHLRALEALP